MEFLSKLLHRKPCKSGGGGGGNGNQTTEVESPVEFQAALIKQDTSTKDPDHLCELSEKSSVRASSEELVELQQTENTAVVKSVDSYPSLPDLLLPEAAYKKQSDTDTDTAEYESAPDTYESATETDHSEGITPAEKYTNQVFDEDVKEQLVRVSVAGFNDLCVKDLPLSPERDSNPESLGTSVLVEDEVNQFDVTFNVNEGNAICLQGTARESCDENTIATRVTDLVDLSLSEAFNNLRLDSPVRKTTAVAEVAEEKASSEIEKTEEIIPLLETSNSAVQADQIVCPIDLTGEREDCVPELEIESTSEHNKSVAVCELDSQNHISYQSVELALQNSHGAGLTLDINTESLGLSNTSEEQTVIVPRKDVLIIQEESVLSNDSNDLLVKSFHIQEKCDLETECLFPEKAEIQTCNVPESKYLLQTEEIQAIVESDLRTVASCDLELKENPIISDCLDSVSSDACENKIKNDPNAILLASDTVVDSVLIKSEGDDSERILLEIGVKKFETIPEVSKFPVGVSSPPIDEQFIVEPFVHEIQSPGAHFSESDKQKQEPLSESSIESLKLLEGTESFITSSTENPGVSVGLEISPQDIVQSQNLYDVDAKDINKLDQLIEICNRQQEDLNQTEVLYEQQVASIGVVEKFGTDSLRGGKVQEILVGKTSSFLEDSFHCAPEERQEFDGIALEASKVALEILNSTYEVDFEADTETHSAVSSRMSESEDSSLHTGSPLQTRNPLLNRSPPQNEKHFQDGGNIKSVRSEVNQSEAGPDIADAPPSQSDDVYWLLLMNRSKLANVFKDSAAFDFLSTVGCTQATHDLRKQSLYMKFDPLVEPVPQTEKSKLPSTEPSREQVPLEPTSEPGKTLEFVEKLISITPTPKKTERMAKRSSSMVPKVLFSSKEEEVEVPCCEESAESKESVIPQIRETPTASSKEGASVPGGIPVLSEADVEMLRKVLKENTGRQRPTKEHQQGDELMAELRESRETISRLEEADKRKERLLSEKSQSLQQMSVILEEYEKTISRLVAEKENEKHAHSLEVARLTKEKDTMSTHLENIEIAFSDVHQKYEKSKLVIQGFVKNEEALRASLAEYESTIKKQEQKYDVLKSHAMSQLESANEELNTVQRNHQVELSKLRAMLKKAELKVTSLEEAIEQKTKENKELVVICDELIGVQQVNRQALN